jgi:hypothetical protein
MLFLLSCQKDKEVDNQSTVTVKLKDNPAVLMNVKVEVLWRGYPTTSSLTVGFITR